MRISYNNTVLAAGELEGPGGLRVGGQQVVQQAQLFHALASAWYGRGNHAQTVSFAVTRAHNNVEDAQFYQLTHYAQIAKAGDLVFTLSDDRAVSLLAAALQGVPEITLSGSTTFTTYNFAGGLLTTSEPPDLEPYADVIRTATIAIPSGTKRVTVNFASSLPNSPQSIAACVIKADADAPNIVLASIEADSITSSGFIATLTATTPDDTYKLSYQAFA